MDKSTLSNYGWMVIVVIVLAIMITLATPFATEIKNNVAGTVTKLQDTGNAALDNVGDASGFDDLGGGAGSGGGSGGETGIPSYASLEEVPELQGQTLCYKNTYGTDEGLVYCPWFPIYSDSQYCTLVNKHEELFQFTLSGTEAFSVNGVTWYKFDENSVITEVQLNEIDEDDHVGQTFNEWSPSLDMGINSPGTYVHYNHQDYWI